MPITGISTLAATLATCSRAIARIAGPETPPVRPPSHGSRVSGWSAMPLSVFTSETASAPALLGGPGHGRRDRPRWA